VYKIFVGEEKPKTKKILDYLDIINLGYSEDLKQKFSDNLEKCFEDFSKKFINTDFTIPSIKKFISEKFSADYIAEAFTEDLKVLYKVPLEYFLKVFNFSETVEKEEIISGLVTPVNYKKIVIDRDYTETSVRNLILDPVRIKAQMIRYKILSNIQMESLLSSKYFSKTMNNYITKITVKISNKSGTSKDSIEKTLYNLLSFYDSSKNKAKIFILIVT